MARTELLFDMRSSQPSVAGVKRHGGGKYAEIVLRRIIERKQPVAVIYDSSRWFNPEIKALCVEAGVRLIDASGTSLKEICDKEKPGLLYTAQSNHDFDNLRGVRRCVTLHGLRWLETPLDSYFWKYPQTFREKIKFLLRKYRPKYMRKREGWRYDNYAEDSDISFVVVSEHTKNSFKAFYPQHTHLEVPVFYSPSTSSSAPVSCRHRAENYFLMVSGTRWEKNNLRAIMALDRLFDNGQLPGFKGIVTGMSHAGKLKYKLRHPERFEFSRYVDDQELEQLYHDAYCFVYPTLNEGFGYPPLEAMRYGVPVIASPFTSVSEVLGDAALYFNPYSVEEIMARMLSIAEPATHKRLSDAGKRRYEVVTARQERDLDALVDYLYNLAGN